MVDGCSYVGHLQCSQHRMLAILPAQVRFAGVEKRDDFTFICFVNAQYPFANLGQVSNPQQFTQRCCLRADFIRFSLAT